MLKDGDCLFSAVAFQLKNRYSMEGIDSPLNQHLRLLGIEADKTDIQTIRQTLRELTVRFKRGFCIFRLLVTSYWYLVLTVLYDVSLASRYIM